MTGSETKPDQDRSRLRHRKAGTELYTVKMTCIELCASRLHHTG